jgi:hypothetical protein
VNNNIDDSDLVHIQRLQELEQSGTVNMFTELEKGLHMMFSTSEAEETYNWVQDNYSYYKSGDWKDVDA